MKKNNLLLTLLLLMIQTGSAQNVGIGTNTPASKLHVKGAADNTQLIIDAHSTQSNTQPLIRLRNSSGADLMWIHSDDATNCFVGLNGKGKTNILDAIYFMCVSKSRFTSSDIHLIQHQESFFRIDAEFEREYHLVAKYQKGKKVFWQH